MAQFPPFSEEWLQSLTAANLCIVKDRSSFTHRRKEDQEVVRLRFLVLRDVVFGVDLAGLGRRLEPDQSVEGDEAERLAEEHAPRLKEGMLEGAHDPVSSVALEQVSPFGRQSVDGPGEQEDDSDVHGLRAGSHLQKKKTRRRKKSY